MTHRRFLVVAAFAVWAQCSAAWAQIIVPAESPEYTSITATVGDGVPQEASYRWLGTPGVSFHPPSLVQREPAYTAPPGPYGVTLFWSVNGTDGKPPQIGLETASGKVAGDPGPVPPGPIKKTLAELVGDKEKAKALGTLYAGLAPEVQAITTVASFKATHAFLLAKQGLANNGAAAEIDKRLAVVLVDPLDHAKLRGVLEAFVAELGSLPPPVPVVEGKRLVVIVAKLQETSPETAAMFNNLRTGAEATYLSSKGHQLLILDEGQETADGAPDPFVAKLKATGASLPAEFVLDPQTKAIIASQAMPSTAAAVVDFVKGNGG